MAEKTTLVPIVTESAHVIVENWQQAAETRRSKSLHIIISALQRASFALSVIKKIQMHLTVFYTNLFFSTGFVTFVDVTLGFYFDVMC